MIGFLDVNKYGVVKEKMQDHIIFYKLKKDNNTNTIIDQGMKLFEAPKKFNLQNPVIEWEITKINDENLPELEVEIKVSNRFLSLFIFIDSEQCDGCELCLSFCPKDLIEISEDKFNSRMLHYAIVVKQEECAGCRQCERLCPTVSLYILEKDNTEGINSE